MTLGSVLFRLTIGALVLFVAGVALAARMFAYEVSPYNEAVANVIAPVGVFLIFGGPCLVVFGGMALVVRWRLPHISNREPGDQSKSIIILTVSLLIIGAVIALVLCAIYMASYATVGCMTKGC